MLKRLTIYLSLLLLGVVLSCIILETGIRIFLPQTLYGGGVSYLDPHLFDLKANFYGEFSHPDYAYSASTDDSRMRNTSTSKLGNQEYTVIFLGDSFTFGLGVNDQETFASLVGEELSKDGARVKVFNAGSPAYTLTESSCKFDRLVETVNPDLVVLVACSNDFVATPLPCSDNRVLHREGTSQGIQSSLWSAVYPVIRDSLLTNSHLAVLLAQRLNYLLVSLNLRDSFGAVTAPYSLASYENDRLRTEYVKKALSEFHAKLKTRNLPGIFVYIPGILEVNDTLWEASQASNDKLLQRDLARNHLLAAAQGAGFQKVIDMRSRITDESGSKYYFPLEMHLNAQGHQFLAKIIAHEINEYSAPKR